MPRQADASVLIHDDGGVRIITLNRPQVRNAVNADLAGQLAAALDDLEEDDSLRVAVLHGSAPDFCTGMDLAAFTTEGIPLVPGSGFAGIAERVAAKPLIAAVEGNALAGGLEIALACDLMVCARSARLGLPEVRRGLVAAAGGLLRLPQRLPRDLAMRLVLTGESIDGATAAAHGLCTVAEDGEAVAAAIDLAQRIAANAPTAVAVSKRVVTESADWSAVEAFARQRDLTDPVFDSDDAREGALSFVERRPPVWTGR